MTQLTEHFSLGELCFSSLAVRRRIDNTPTAEQVANLTVLAQSLERIRKVLGHPMHIDSGFRSQKLNTALGGSKTSAHMDGRAADFVCSLFGSPADIGNAIIEADIPFDQLILEGEGQGAWLHFGISKPEQDPRGEMLQAHFSQGGTTYTPMDGFGVA